MRHKFLVAVLVTATVVTGAVATKNMSSIIGEKVVEVVDGDTFIIENRQPIRLYGLNAPELQYCMGDAARRELSSLILGKRVEPLADGRGRVLALVYQDRRLINEVMIREGFAVYHRQGGSETERMKSAHDYAWTHHIGIYSPTCFQTIPPDPSCAIKGNYDANRRVRQYFVPSCSFYSLVEVKLYEGDNWFCTEKEAEKAGFIASDDCKNI